MNRPRAKCGDDSWGTGVAPSEAQAEVESRVAMTKAARSTAVAVKNRRSRGRRTRAPYQPLRSNWLQVAWPPVKPWQTLATAGALTLKTRGDEFLVLTDGKVLMGSKRHGSEDELAVKGCEGLNTAAPRVLIAGLGFGYTLRKALDLLPSDAHVTLCELSPALVVWNRTLLGHLAQDPLADPRVELIEGDVRDTLKRNDATFNAIVLDVDNGPFAVSHPANAGLYSSKGLKLIHQALAAKGTAVIWSASDDAAFKRRFDDAHFAKTRTWSIAGSQHVLFIGKK